VNAKTRHRMPCNTAVDTTCAPSPSLAPASTHSQLPRAPPSALGASVALVASDNQNQKIEITQLCAQNERKTSEDSAGRRRKSGPMRVMEIQESRKRISAHRPRLLVPRRVIHSQGTALRVREHRESNPRKKSREESGTRIKPEA
jgi:hypothetical protein